MRGKEGKGKGKRKKVREGHMDNDYYFYTTSKCTSIIWLSHKINSASYEVHSGH